MTRESSTKLQYKISKESVSLLSYIFSEISWVSGRFGQAIGTAG